MPLPPTLAARLAKRGLVNEAALRAQEKKQRTEPAEEEVIAENYDNNFKISNLTPNVILPPAPTTIPSHDGIRDMRSLEEAPASIPEKIFKGHPGCPNKWNVFHECSTFCVKQWGKGITIPEQKYLRSKARMLVKYPLPNNWKEVYDAGTGRHYYWDTHSDLVSWLPPGHPRSKVTESAASTKEERHLKVTDVEASDHESDSAGEEEEEEDGRERLTREFVIEKFKSRSKTKNNDLDPMDPASYSEIPRGKWSDGLDKGNEAKTGADVTASGPLFQMRPYPNPGAVLRANAKP